MNLKTGTKVYFLNEVSNVNNVRVGNTSRNKHKFLIFYIVFNLKINILIFYYGKNVMRNYVDWWLIFRVDKIEEH